MAKRDPSRTVLLRRRFEIDLRKRLKAIAKKCKILIVTEDAFGLKPRKRVKLTDLQSRQYEFRTNPQKIAAFRTWLQQQVDAGLLTIVNSQPWTNQYVESAYKKGIERAYLDSTKAGILEKPEFYAGSRQQFLRSAFYAPETLEKLELLSTRVFEELKGIGAVTSQQLNRLLTESIVNGYGPEKIARNIDNSISRIDRTRARVIARTEVINAHAEGQLDSFKQLGIDEVSAEVEWTTAGDERVCPDCEGMEGRTYKVEDAHGLIPLHPNCRCAWLPVLTK